MLTCEDLLSVWSVKKSLARAVRRLDDLAGLAESNNSVLNGMPHCRSSNSKVEKIVIMMDDCRSLISDLSEQLVAVKVDLLLRIQSFALPELLERVLFYHYVSCLRFRDIGKRLHYSGAYVSKLHAKALAAVGLSVEDMNRVKIGASC